MINKKTYRFIMGKLSGSYFRKLLFNKYIFTVVSLIAVLIQYVSGGSVEERYKFDIAAGYGFPETLCLKLRYGNNFQAGISQSFDTHGLGAGAVELYYRLGEKPRFSEQKPWYALLGAAVYLFQTDYKKEYSFLLYPRAGRTFEFSRYLGINADIGFGVPFGRDAASADPIPPVILTGSINLYFRF